MKAWAYAAIVVGLIAAFGATYMQGNMNGYDRRDQEVQQDIIDAQQLASEAAEAHWSAALEAANKAIKVEERIVEKIREVEILVPTIVERIVEVKPECSDLGLDYAGLLNNQVRAGNDIQITTTAGELDE